MWVIRGVWNIYQWVNKLLILNVNGLVIKLRSEVDRTSKWEMLAYSHEESFCVC